MKNNIRTFVMLLLSFALGHVQAQNTANPNASSDTKKVLEYMAGLKNKNNTKLLLGQDLGHGNSMLPGQALGYDAFVDGLHNQTGKWLGLIGGDYGLDNNHTVWQTNQLLTDYWEDGGLVTLSWHFNNPWTGGSTWDTNNNENLYDLITPGNYAYNNWQNQLQQLANALRPLRDAGVVVLWRPLHEMNGDWFWWGEKTWGGHENAYKDLYRDMFNYLTYEQGMNNLLWVYSVGNTWNRTVRNYYPGSDYVDIVGMDIYDDNADTYDSWQDYQDMKSLGHPMGFTEFGPTLASANGYYDYRRLVNKIKSSYPDFVFSYSWSDWYEGGRQVKIAYASNQYAWQTFNDSWVITRDEINWRDSNGNGDDDDDEPGGVEGELRIKNLWSNTYLHQNGNYPGAAVSLHGYNQNWYSQRWNIESAEGGSYRLRCSWGGNYLNNTGNYNDAPVNVYSLNNNWWSQMWLVENAENNIYRLKNRWTNRYLHTSNQYNVSTYNGNPNWWSQLWVFEYISQGNRADTYETIDLTISPNPTTDVIYLNDFSENTDYIIYDTSGKMVAEGTGVTINVSQLINGTYLLTAFPQDEENEGVFGRALFVKK